MTVKEKRGRRRYIAFNVNARFSKETLTSKMRALCSDRVPFSVIQCSSGWAIVRCSPETSDTVVALVAKADPESSSISTSGTLKTLRQTYPVLEAERPPRRS